MIDEAMIDEGRLDQLLSLWQYRQAQGQELPAAELCGDCPELLSEVEHRLLALRKMQQLLVTNEPQSIGEAGPRARAATAAPPKFIGNYEILGELGRGGMGVVYKARQTALKRLVALKVILTGCQATAELQDRFRAEAEMVASLKHPNIIEIHEIGEADGHPFFSLEFVEGGGLDDKLAGTPLPPAEAARLMETLARAVHHAHQHGIVHRDLKPGNVLLTANGTPKITDFGIAKQLEADAVTTQTGTLLGTPSYMAPEQAAGNSKDIGPVTDVYALGATFYEMLTGRPPFKAATILETLEQVRFAEPVPPSQLQTKVPRDLETICLKCLRKDPRRRYASALELAEDLVAYGEGRPIRARPVGAVERAWRWSKGHRATAGMALVSAVAGAALLGVGFWYSVQLGAAHAEQDRLELQNKAAEAEKIAAQKVADTQLFYRLLSQSRECMVRPVPGWTECSAEELRRAAALPPASERMPELLSGLAVCLAGVDVQLTNTAGEGLDAARLAFDPQGRWLAIGQTRAPPLVGRCAVLLLDARTGAVAQQLWYTPSLALKHDGTTSLLFSRDGRWLVAGTRSGKMHRWDLTQKDPSAQSWTGHKDTVARMQFSPDGMSLYSLHNDRTLKRWDTTADGSWGEATRALLPGPSGQFAVSPLSDWLVYQDSDQLRFMTADTLKPIRAPVAARGNRLALSPNGRTLALEWNREISLLDVEAGKIVRVLKSPDGGPAQDDDVTDLHFSPDGALLATSSEWAHQVRLWDVSSGRLLADWTVGEGTAHVAFRADGRALAVCTDAATLLYDLRRPVLCTTAALSPRPLTGFALHPDGKHLMCLGEGVNQLMELTWWQNAGVAPVARWQVNRGRQGITCPLAIAADGKQLAYASASGVDCWNLEAGSIGPTFGVADTGLLQFAPDGRLWGATSHTINAWEVPRPRPVLTWKNSMSQVLTGRGKVNALAVGKEWAVVAGRDGAGHLLRCEDASVGVRFDTSVDCQLQSAALSPSETWAALGTDKGEVLLYDVRSGALLKRMTPHRGSVTALVFVSDELLVSGSSDRSVRLTTIDGPVTTELLSLASSGPVRQIAFMPHEGVLAVLAQDEGAVRLWHLNQLWPQLKKIAPAAILPPLPTAAPPAVTAPKLPPVSTAQAVPGFLRKIADPETVLLATAAATR